MFVDLLEIIEALCLIYVRLSTLKCLSAFGSEANRSKSNSGKNAYFSARRFTSNLNLSKLANILLCRLCQEEFTTVCQMSRACGQ